MVSGSWRPFCLDLKVLSIDDPWCGMITSLWFRYLRWVVFAYLKLPAKQPWSLFFMSKRNESKLSNSTNNRGHTKKTIIAKLTWKEPRDIFEYRHMRGNFGAKNLSASCVNCADKTYYCFDKDRQCKIEIGFNYHLNNNVYNLGICIYK